MVTLNVETMNVKYYIDDRFVKVERGLADYKMATFLVFENWLQTNDEKRWLEGYNVIDGHFGEIDNLYLNNCREITKEEYLKNTYGWYTPNIYL